MDETLIPKPQLTKSLPTETLQATKLQQRAQCKLARLCCTILSKPIRTALLFCRLLTDPSLSTVTIVYSVWVSSSNMSTLANNTVIASTVFFRRLSLGASSYRVASRGFVTAHSLLYPTLLMWNTSILSAMSRTQPAGMFLCLRNTLSSPNRLPLAQRCCLNGTTQIISPSHSTSACLRLRALSLSGQLTSSAPLCLHV